MLSSALDPTSFQELAAKLAHTLGPELALSRALAALSHALDQSNVSDTHQFATETDVEATAAASSLGRHECPSDPFSSFPADATITNAQIQHAFPLQPNATGMIERAKAGVVLT